ncbi:MAG: PAS domain S-box protein [Melioribacteraceae bacterium]|nr:PAS domain S-box protein [Melioribacteraceae bacterium]
MKLKKPRKEEVRILVVDDETIVALDIKNTLEKYDYNVIGVAANGGDAIKMVKSSKPNLILMDIMLKGSKDGIEVSTEINKIADIPIIFLTAYSDDNTLERAKMVEPYGYLIKPFDNRELFTTIEMSLYKHAMELNLRESEESLSITLNSIGDGVISTDEKGFVARMNPVAEKLTGWKISDVKGKHLDQIFNIIDATTRKPLLNPVEKVIRSGEVIGLSNHTILISRDGNEINISDSAAPIRDSEGEIKGVVLVFSDVTETYNTRKIISESEEKFRLLITQMHQGMAVHEVIYDKKENVIDYRFIEVNESFEKITGLKREKILGKSVLEVLPDTETYWIEKYGEVVKTGKPLTYENYAHELNKYFEVVAYRNRPDQFAVILSDITERKIAEEGLRIKDQAIASSINAIALANLDGNLTYVNDSFLQLWGYENVRDVLGRSSLEFWQNPDSAKVVFEAVIENGNFIGELKAKSKNGKLLDLFLTSTLIYGADGKPVQIMASFIDITERKRVEENLITSEEKFRTLFDTMPNGYYRSTPDGYFVDANPSFIKMLGYESLEELKKLFIPRDIFIQISEREKILTSNPDFISDLETYRLKTKDGRILWIEDNARYIKDKDGNVIFNEGICRDITDRKQAEDALRESEQLFNTLAQVSPAGIFRTKPDGYTTYVNPTWKRLAGLSAEKAMGDGWIDAVHPDDKDKLLSDWKVSSEKEDVSVAEYRFLRPDGNIVWVMGQAIPEFSPDNEIVGYVGTITDITERKLAEDALKESEERLRILAEKTGTIVYDWNLVTNSIHRDGAIEDVLGYSIEEFRKLNAEQYYDLFSENEINEIKLLTDSVIKSGGNYTHFYQLRNKNGNYIYIEDNGIVIKDKDGKSRRMLGSLKDITERRLTELALKESEELHRKLLMTVPDLIIRTNLNGDIIFVNESALQSLDYVPRENLLGKNMLTFITDKDKERAVNNTRLMFNRQLGIQEYTLKFEDGIEVITEVNGDVIMDAESKPVGMVYVVRDITERKKAEENLRKLSHAVEQSQVSIVITNTIGVIEYVNPKFCEVTGYTYDEAIGQNPNILKSGDWKPEAYSGMWSDISSGRNWTGIFHNKKKNGELFWESAHISPIKNPDGEITHYIAVKEDITEKVKAEDELTRYREHLEEMVEERTVQVNSKNIFLRTLIDTIPNPLFVKDSLGFYTDVNPAFEKFFNKKREEIIGKKVDSILSDDSINIVLETDEKLRKRQGIVSYEITFEKGDGTKVPVIIYKSSFGISSTVPEGIMGMFIDISERKEMEEKTIQALKKERELNEMKTNFISMASHEFRTPLTTILASADLVEMYQSKWSAEKVMNHIKKIQDSVSYMATLLDDVLTLSRADRGKLKFTPAKTHLKEMCMEILDEINYQALPGHNFIFNYNLKEDIINVDRKLLNQILNNLLSNAVKFSPEGGQITLEVSEFGDKIQFTVNDEGMGIDNSDLKNIFEPFFRGKNVTEIHGSGLGLNIVKNAVELHGGEISIESELNKGSKFIFTIKPKD